MVTQNLLSAVCVPSEVLSVAEPNMQPQVKVDLGALGLCWPPLSTELVEAGLSMQLGPSHTSLGPTGAATNWVSLYSS